MADEPTPDVEPENHEPAPVADELGDAGKRAIAEERKARRDAEKRLKEQEAQLEQFRLATLSEQERMVEETRTQAYAEGLRQGGAKLVRSELKAEAKGRLDDGQLATLLEGLDLTKFLNADGEPDEASIVAFVDGIAPRPQESDEPQGFPDLGQGPRHGRTGSPGMALNGDPLEKSLRAALGIR